MSRFIAPLKAICGKLLKRFVQARLVAELPGADELIRHWDDHPSDDPRTGSGLTMAGIL